MCASKTCVLNRRRFSQRGGGCDEPPYLRIRFDRVGAPVEVEKGAARGAFSGGAAEFT
jgi:hypothetical protein